MTFQRTIKTFIVAIAFASISFAVAQSQDSAPATNSATSANNDSSNSEDADAQEFRLREGMKFVEQIGELKDSGGRITFYPDGQTQSLQLLENLALERVSGDLDRTHRKWSVTGIITEFKGSNYLLLHRAVLKARSTKASGPRS